MQSSNLKNFPLWVHLPYFQRDFRISRYSFAYVSFSVMGATGHIPICSYSALFQPVTMLRPQRPSEISSIVAIILATTAGCWLNIEIDGNKPMEDVTEAMADIRVNDSRQESQ